MEDNYQLITKTVAGLEDVLAAEIRNLGAKNVKLMHRAVICEGNKEMMYRLNYNVRTGLKVLKPFKTFFAKNPDELYKKVQEIQWWELLRTDQTFCVDAVTSGRFFTHSQYAALKTKDAIVDQFRDVMGPRPSINTLNPDLRIIDCMCGSGTLPIEAAMYAMKIPAGYYRKQWGFMKWDDWDPELWKRIKDEADSQIVEFEHEIWASDRSPKAVAIAEGNINNAHLQHDIHLMKKNMEDLTPPEEGGIVIINPPYGDRLEEDDIDQVYENIGNTLKHNFQGYQCWLITDDAVALKHVGLKPTTKIPVWNGPLECRFVRFDIFGGSLKDWKTGSYCS